MRSVRQAYGDFLSILRNGSELSLDELGQLTGTSRSMISRLENGEISQPFRGQARKTVLALAQVLCTTQNETERYLEFADINRVLLTDAEKIQLGFAPHVTPGSSDEQSQLEQLAHLYREALGQIEIGKAEIGIRRIPPNLKRKAQEYTNLLQEIQRRFDTLESKQDQAYTAQTVRVHYAKELEGKIVVGHMYGNELDTEMIRDLHTLASPNATWLMDLAGVERLAIDDCIILTNSKRFQGWEPSEIKTTVLSSRLPVPDDLETLKSEKLKVIEKDFFNSSHYRLVSFTPSFSDMDQLEVILAPVGFHEYYSLTPFFDEPLLRALDGSPVSIRQKYGNTALTYTSTDRGTCLIPSPISIQCVVLTADEQIVLMQRSPSVAFYPSHWSASFEETMNAPGLNRKGQPSRSDDADFFAGALRGLDEELAVTPENVESLKVLSLNVEYLTLSMDVLTMAKLRLTGEEIRQSWIVDAWDRDEASRFALLPADLHSVIDKLFSKTLWHPTARMRLVQYLFHRYGTKSVADALKERQHPN